METLVRPRLRNHIAKRLTIRRVDMAWAEVDLFLMEAVLVAVGEVLTGVALVVEAVVMGV
jgi:hypothetical protein